MAGMQCGQKSTKKRYFVSGLEDGSRTTKKIVEEAKKKIIQKVVTKTAETL